MIIDEIEKDLFLNQDLKYKDFTAKLVPNVDKEKFIGVRNPVIRKLAKKYANNEEIGVFLNELPHKYIEENNLHGLILCEFKDYGKTVQLLDAFLPYVNNWATCDIISPKCFKKHKDLLLKDILRWLKSTKTYTLRFAIQMVMSHFLDEAFDKSYNELISKVKSDEYYVNMMIAWYFATALAKQYDDTVPYIKNNVLPKWVHNKTIQKAVESFRITNEQKEYLKSLKI